MTDVRAFFAANPRGTRVSAIVRNTTGFALTLEIDDAQVSAVLPKSDLAVDPETREQLATYVSEGDRLECWVWAVPPDARLIKLTKIPPEQDPWTKVGDKQCVGRRVSATILGRIPRGLRVRTDEGIEGTLPNTERAWRERPDPELEAGDSVGLVIIDVSDYQRDVKLSLRRLTPRPVAPFWGDDELDGDCVPEGASPEQEETFRQRLLLTLLGHGIDVCNVREASVGHLDPCTLFLYKDDATDVALLYAVAPDRFDLEAWLDRSGPGVPSDADFRELDEDAATELLLADGKVVAEDAFARRFTAFTVMRFYE